MINRQLKRFREIIFLVFAVLSVTVIILIGVELNAKKDEKFLEKPIVIRQINPRDVDFVVLQNNTSSEMNIGKYALDDGNSVCTIPKNTMIPAHDKIHIYFSQSNSIFSGKTGRVIVTGDIQCDTLGIAPGETINLMNDSGELLDSGDAL